MKRLSTEMLTFTEIGGAGEMIYKAVRFPDYYWEFDHEIKEDVIVPVFSYTKRPTAGTDYSLTGLELLANLCNLYRKINNPDSSANITELVWDWCRNNIHPYYIDDLCDIIESADFKNPNIYERLRGDASFLVSKFVHDLSNLGSTFEYYDVLNKVYLEHDASAGRKLYYEGRIRESIPLLEKYKQYTDDDEYIKQISAKYDSLMKGVITLFPAVKMNLKQNNRTKKIEMGAEVHSVFDIAWYSFVRMVATVAPPPDTNPDYMFSQSSILTCMACGDFFVRHSSRQRYCNNPDCQAERNNRKARAYYKRKKEYNPKLSGEKRSLL
ncbi:MAG: CGNR zinc finger domain-containing protein [Clostridia bacterium]|nr:CGNR zinc finger domain-containing protein [Clostridia bacterium]